MMHYFIGNLGHFFVITAFVSGLLASFAYWRATLHNGLEARNDWTLNGRASFLIHAAAVIGIIATLFVIIYQHYFEYHYAYTHSSRHLPGQYMISCFWEGQEGSFLLWMFWHAVIGLFFIFSRQAWEAPVMTIFSLVQAFLASMILGVIIPGLDLKIGSSPFILLREALADPIFTLQPDFIPKDGNGLNPLLQNYWMVIHPPTLFLGFALTLVPFSFAIAGLWLRKYTEWIRPALPWTLLGGAILGVGILMGGYWAYETLSFGGYWNWDPVENAVYVPWLVLIASLHSLLIARTNTSALKLSILLVLAVFLLILYSTFLTRSGILGDASVHSFTDLGLSGQLLIYLLVFVAAAAYLTVSRWKELPADEKEVSTYSREFWIFLGAATLCLMGFQVLVPTSIPVYNKVLEIFGTRSNLAPPANQVEFYSRIQLWFGVGVALLSGTAQFFWWKKMDRSRLRAELVTPIMISLILLAALIVATQITDPTFMALGLAGLYVIVSNSRMLFKTLKTNPRLSGGGIAHIGMGLMLIGVLYSAGYSKIVSLNNTGLLYNKEMGTEFNRDNLLLFVNEPRTMAGYEIEFLGERLEPRNKSGYVKRNEVEATTDPFNVVAKRDILFKEKMLYKAGDTIEIYPENTFYEIALRQEGETVATLFPRVQMNPSMGGILPSPDIRRNADRDLYTHVSAPMNRDAEPDWSEVQELKVHPNDKFFVNDYVAYLDKVERITQLPGLRLSDEDVAVKVTVRIEGEHDTYLVEPLFIIRNRTEVGRIPDEAGELGVRLTLLNIHPQENEFVLGLQTRQKDWVIIKAMEKPYINILWLGTGLITIGFLVAMVRRFRDESRPVSEPQSAS